MTIKDFAQNVAENIESPAYKFDPTIILVIIEIITAMIEKCNEDPERIHKMANGPNLLQRILLKWHTRKVCGHKLYREVGTDICNGIIKTADRATFEEFNQAYSEIR